MVSGYVYRYIVHNFFSFSDIEYLKQTLPETIESEFYVFLRQLTAKDVVLYAIDEGSVAFPRYVAFPILVLNSHRCEVICEIYSV